VAEKGAPETLRAGGEGFSSGERHTLRPGEDEWVAGEPKVLQRAGGHRWDAGEGENGVPDLPAALLCRKDDAEDEEPCGERGSKFRPRKRRPPDGDERHNEVERVIPRYVEGEEVERDREEEGDKRVILGVSRPEEVGGAADRGGKPEDPQPSEPSTSRKIRKAMTPRRAKAMLFVKTIAATSG